jgi:hypothetical protein
MKSILIHVGIIPLGARERRFYSLVDASVIKIYSNHSEMRFNNRAVPAGKNLEDQAKLAELDKFK